MALLLESGEIPPAVFVLHPKRESPIGDERSPGTPLSPAQIQEHAQRLATDHQVDPKPLRDTELLKRLEQARRWIHQVCLDLSEASRLEQSVPPTAEWLLDNEYIIESNARDVQLNLPRRYYRQLPALASEPYRGLPRIYGLARELVSHTDLRLDQENILAFIEAYQSVSPLTIGELWAVPQMLRMALIESIQHLAARALTELREREIADFWANRLITANRRDPNQLFSILAELTETQPSPSPYFASQLIDYLYDEEAALAPVQSWLERTLQQILERSQPAREEPPDEGSDIDRECVYQLATARPAGLERYASSSSAGWSGCCGRIQPASIPRWISTRAIGIAGRLRSSHRGSGQAEDQVAQRAIELAAQAAA